MDKDLNLTEVISLEGVYKKYPQSKQFALKDINLKIKRGEFFCLVGPSGCGKSTLLKLLASIEKPSQGSVQKPDKVGMVFQSGALLPWLSVEENTMFGLKMTGTASVKAREKAHYYLHLVGLDSFLHKMPRELSGGQRQRVGIARALSIEPKVLLLDEPFSALDAVTTEELHKDLLKIWRETKKTIVMVSHLIEEAVELGERVGVMSQGELRSIIDITLPIGGIPERIKKLLQRS